MKYKVGDLLTTGLCIYLVIDIRNGRYIAKETSGHSTNLYWNIYDADNDRYLKKVN